MAFLGLLLCKLAIAQQYIIQYDVSGDNIRYLRVKKPGDTIATSVVHLSKTNSINMQLVNVANSYQRQIILHEKIETPEAVIIPGIGNTALSNLPSGLLNLDVKNIKPEELFKQIISDNKSIDVEMEQRSLAMLHFTNSYNDFNANYAKWEKAILFEQESRQLWKELAGLRYSLQYNAPTVKQTARIKTQTVFPEIVNNANALLLKKGILNPQSVAIELQKNNQSLASNYASFASLDIQSLEASLLVKQTEEKMNFVKTINNSFDEASSDDFLLRIADLYNQIMGDSYSQLTNLPVNRRTVMAEIQFIPKIDSITTAAIGINLKDTLTRWVTIYKKEPLKFRNTFGFGFVSFAENRWNYFVASDSTIAREKGDAFQPVIVTYLHFYSPRDKGFRWGGSFGIGIPISGDEKQLNMMLGLSTFFGKNDPVCITAGIAGAKVRTLSGMSVGDKVGFIDYNIKYQSVYRSSYFISFSFNPAALNNKE
jgi:hypothetical protein